MFDTVSKKFNMTDKDFKPMSLNLKFKKEDKMKFEQMKEILKEKYFDNR